MVLTDSVSDFRCVVGFFSDLGGFDVILLVDSSGDVLW